MSSRGPQFFGSKVDLKQLQIRVESPSKKGEAQPTSSSTTNSIRETWTQTGHQLRCFVGSWRWLQICEATTKNHHQQSPQAPSFFLNFPKLSFWRWHAFSPWGLRLRDDGLGVDRLFRKAWKGQRGHSPLKQSSEWHQALGIAPCAGFVCSPECFCDLITSWVTWSKKDPGMQQSQVNKSQPKVPGVTSSCSGSSFTTGKTASNDSKRRMWCYWNFPWTHFFSRKLLRILDTTCSFIRSVVLGPLKHHLYPARTSCSCTDASGRLEEVGITAAGRPGFGDLSFIYWAVDERGSKCVRLFIVLTRTFSMESLRM